MAETTFHFVDKETVEQITKLTQDFLEHGQSPEDLVNKVKEMLPVHKTDQSTWKRRVEGYYEVSEILFGAVFDKGQAKYGEDWNRQKVVSEAKLRPFSYYHWMTGSREPAANVRDRDDYLNDPTTAMIKLEDDIKGLGTLYKKLTES